MRIIVSAKYYRQFDANCESDVPAESYGGWSQEELPLSLAHTAVVVMHAVDAGTPALYPGWHRAVEYIPRSYAIVRDVFPDLLRAVRNSPLRLFHVAMEGDYYRGLPGYTGTVRLAGDEPRKPDKIGADPVLEELRDFRTRFATPGGHNLQDIRAGQAKMDFIRGAEPLVGEGIADTTHQLYKLCEEQGINHLIYIGFAINGCLLYSPGGMVDMSRRGLLCSTIADAVTAIENKETAREQSGKSSALWLVSLAFGYVYEARPFIRALTEQVNDLEYKGGYSK